MKKSLLLVAFLAVGFAYQTAHAQVSISASINIGPRPVWAPADYAYADNYYFPEYDMYYDVYARQYRYLDRGRWMCSPVVPACYARVDLVRARRVVIHERNPYLRNDYWRGRYRNDRRDFDRRDQGNYRDDHRGGGRNDWDRHDRGPGNDRGNGNGRYSDHRDGGYARHK